MVKVYMFRHQVAGIVPSHVFLKSPTDEQLAPIRAECERLHGKTGWGTVHEAELLDDGVPSFPERAAGPIRASGSGNVGGTAGAIIGISGEGTVTPLEGLRAGGCSSDERD